MSSAFVFFNTLVHSATYQSLRRRKTPVHSSTDKGTLEEHMICYKSVQFQIIEIGDLLIDIPYFYI
jgi:hypothetical protein